MDDASLWGATNTIWIYITVKGMFVYYPENPVNVKNNCSILLEGPHFSKTLDIFLKLK